MLKLSIDKNAGKTLEKLKVRNQKQAIAIVTVIEILLKNPVPKNSRKLSGHSPLRRVRVGNWRIVYKEDGTTVYILLIGLRGSVYQALAREGR